MGVIRVTGRLICATAEEVALVEELLGEHIRLSRAEPGCQRFEVVRSALDPMVWELDEAFVDAAAFEAHQARLRASEWGRASRHIARDYTVSHGD